MQQMSSVTQEIHILYGTRWFIAAFTSARQLSLSWAKSIQSMPPSAHFLKINS